MSSLPRKESDSSLASTKSAISSIINLKNKCLYKKEILSTLQKLPISINKDGLLKNISKIHNLNNEKKDKPILINALKNNYTNSFQNKKNKIIVNKINIEKNNKEIEKIILNLKNLFIQLKNLFTNYENCNKECEEFIDLFNNNFDTILEKTKALEYMPLINNSMNLILLSIILIYSLSNNEKYYLFEFDSNKILDCCKTLIEVVFEKCINPNEINLKEKSNVITNLYINISNSLNIIISKYDQIIPLISNDLDLILKNIRRINYKEIYNFYKEKIKNTNEKNKKIKETKIEENPINIFKHKPSQSYREPNRNINYEKENKGYSKDNNNSTKKHIYLNSASALNSYRIQSPNFSYNAINESNDIGNINNVNAFSIGGLIFPYKRFKSKNHRKYNYTNETNSNHTSYNNKIYHTVDGSCPDSHVKIIINENPDENNNNYNENYYDNENNNNYNENYYDNENNNNNNSNIYATTHNLNLKKNFIDFYNPIQNSLNKNYTKNSRRIQTKRNTLIIPFKTNKNYTIIINLDETLIHCFKNNKIILRNNIIDFLSSLIPYYELISFTYGNKNYSDKILNLIEEKEKYFDFNLYKENSTYLNEEYYKNFDKLGRDIKRTIIIEDIDNNLGNKNDNSILIKSFIKNERDLILKNLSILLIKIAKEENDDVRKSIKMYQKEIKTKLT